ncbi:type II toxin-antitoxin system VapC family toxin [Bifidobacterium avesanii]|uniref:Ribonuclease VapC n=1 Tax=Bifidobacterium avesanii TaxID=1798157 RepID=A0A7K3THS3_9BIFI|nr:type II toxin-antitoxin system VapC family toxin [Bifidobacterium avesanii]KAB8294362.1 PIN domain-containing protein [Bifidobacterium avesanii]NEG77803.1 PIN domain-containing protein [Bifidobacterium avesanii]
MIVLDTNVVSEIISRPKPNEAVRDWIISQPLTDMYLTSITVAELLFGVALLDESRKKQRIKQAVSACIETFRNRTIPFDSRAAPHYAVIVAARQRMGNRIGPQDAMIAAIARSRGMAVATRNVRDFEGTGVELINPWERPRSG